LAEDRGVADGEAAGVGDGRPEPELFGCDAVEVGEFVEGRGVDGGVAAVEGLEFGPEFGLDFGVGGEEPGGPG
jgi:hypothetical protein